MKRIVHILVGMLFLTEETKIKVFTIEAFVADADYRKIADIANSIVIILLNVALSRHDINNKLFDKDIGVSEKVLKIQQNSGEYKRREEIAFPNNRSKHFLFTEEAIF